MSRMSRRGGRGRRGIREYNIIVFGRKLKIVEIVRLPTLPREKCGSGPLFFLRRLPFFPLSPSVYLLFYSPEMQYSYRRIVVKGIGKSIHLLQNIPQG